MSEPLGNLWKITSHVCGVCFGRVLARETKDGTEQRVFRCSNCGLERQGHDHRVVCSCGMKLKTGRGANLRCMPNTTPTPECPSEIVVEEISSGFPQKVLDSGDDDQI